MDDLVPSAGSLSRPVLSASRYLLCSEIASLYGGSGLVSDKGDNGRMLVGEAGS